MAILGLDHRRALPGLFGQMARNRSGTEEELLHVPLHGSCASRWNGMSRCRWDQSSYDPPTDAELPAGTPVRDALSGSSPGHGGGSGKREARGETAQFSVASDEESTMNRL